ncbi:MAG: NAD(P)H-dependent oxidoreductase [Pelolinea sp.]|nr:NAD(P)H-dependent oxidoreductase [Pelolinea sp.]
MKITILDGALNSTLKSWKTYLHGLTAALEHKGHEVNHFNLKDNDLHYCTGCFKCWVQTPGICTILDDNQKINRVIINSDLVLFASPLVMGFATSLLKKKMDRMIPLVHPYLTVEHGEVHHLPRYEKYPLFGLLVQPEKADGEDTLTIVTQIFSRTTRNIKSRLAFSATTSEPVQKIVERIENAAQGKDRFEPIFRKKKLEQVGKITSMTIFNGSPRGRSGNTPILLQKIMDGFISVEGNTAEMNHLFQTKKRSEFAHAFENAQCVLIGFPLYTDGMPGIVKEFIEGLEPFVKRKNNPPMAFLVQSGFPEGLHSRYVEQYLISLTDRLNSPYLGTLVRGGCEGVRLQPENFNRKMFGALNALGNQLGMQGGFEKESIGALCSLERYPKALIPLISLLEKTPMLQMYWSSQLKKNNVFNDRFARPYEETID